MPRTRAARIAIAATVISGLGLLGSLIGRAVGAKGFGTSDKDVSALSTVCFLCTTIGLVIAVVAGAICWRSARRSGQAGGVRAELVVAAYVVLAAAGIAVLTAG